ncbi:metallophosphoesterase family protein [Clostridium sp. cel8]|uniref:metallophosphoesterase family protein n=1 Tax=unclassified Clostridium TaxID=2614128 RepID=UPI0015F5FED4|nr:metallophosphoesterase family protein [Clostridium sp. cel8]
MKYFMMSDIHGNLEALESACEILKSFSVDKVIVLGDIVGYMCNPNECIDIVKKFECIKGNHDYAVTHMEMLHWFNPMAQYALKWTKNVLKHENYEFLEELPYKRDYNNFTVVHGDISSPKKFNYLLGEGYLVNINFQKMENPILFVGHTHYPCIFEKNEIGDIRCIDKKLGDCITLDIKHNKYIINVGSVGQPRDGNEKGCCILFDDELFEVRYIRFKYDINSVVKKMMKNHMPELLYTRLYAGR